MLRSQLNAHLSDTSIGVVGAGIIGLACAVELADRGAKVTVFDKGPAGKGASWAAAGMLSPAYEAATERNSHPGLFQLCLESAAMWPAFARDIEKRSGMKVGFRPGPSLAVSTDMDESANLERIASRLARQSIDFEYLFPEKLRELSPGLGADVQDGLLLPTDGHVDNRRLVQALVHIAEQTPHITLRANTPVHSLDEVAFNFDFLLNTAGWQSAGLSNAARSVRPVAGQLLSVAKSSDIPEQTLRCGLLYIAPKQDRIVIGATVEPDTVLETPDPAQIEALHQQASLIYPGLEAAPRLESWCGVRPGTPDHAPMIGQVKGKPIFMATGHYRNGVLLAPITAKIIGQMIAGEPVGDSISAFSPRRFERIST